MKYKILAVDDNPINIKLLSRALVNSEYQILTAGSGREALDIAVKEFPDLILLDVMMDDMDGYKVCTELQNHNRTNHIPVIFLSAKNESVDKARGLALGAVDYLTKPFDAVEINARVHTHLTIRKDRIRLQRENEELQKQLIASDAQIAQYLNSIKTDLVFENKSFACAAKVKSAILPQTSGFLPLLQDETQFVFLILNGFKKNYATLAVELLFEQYAAGYLASTDVKNLEAQKLPDLVNKLMERFSPDIYKVAFSFALGWLCKKDRSLSFYGIRQDLPMVINADGLCSTAECKPLDFTGKFAELISAQKLKLPQKSAFCFYRTGIEKVSEESYNDLFSASVKIHSVPFSESIDKIYNLLPPSKQDQLISIIQIK